MRYLISFSVLIGAISTSLWLNAIRYPDLSSDLFSFETVSILFVCFCLTIGNLVIRWFRWHFLIRRFTRSITTRDSIAVYFATLPAIVTPFSVGELIRIIIFKRQYPDSAKSLFYVWLIERSFDAGILLGFFCFTINWRYGLFVWLLFCVLSLSIPRILKIASSNTVFLSLGPLVFFKTFCAWILPVLGLFYLASVSAKPISIFAAAKIFSSATLFGGFTGLPVGISIAGSNMINQLISLGVTFDSAVITILLFRLSTVWFAFILGVASFLFWRSRLGILLKNNVTSEHFDEIAVHYESQIPDHVRDRLLGKKIKIIDSTLEKQGISVGAKGLDLGCGQGWYLSELLEKGYMMHGLDYSRGQLNGSAHYLREKGLGSPLVHADGKHLPFGKNTFDFVYSINALHHIVDPKSQRSILDEIIRVLKPGGVFLLHEINTINPLFRFYMGYIFPLIRKIDEGNEEWILPSALPEVRNGRWLSEVIYFTFLPDFVPEFIQNWFIKIEQRLEKSRFRRFSAHYQACLVKEHDDY